MPIENLKVIDQDVPGWIKILRENGLSAAEIDEMLSRLNVEYSKASGIDPIEKELERIEKDLWDKHKRTLDKEQREYMRRSISERPEFKDFKK